MEGAIFDCPKEWTWLLPPAVSRMEQADLLVGRVWDLLALTETGCKQLRAASCRTLLVPGDLDPAVLQWIQAERVITYGLSQRDSLTLSSLSSPVLCVQRTLPRPDGGAIESQEFPLPPLPGPAERLLPLLGLRLLLLPPSQPPFSW